mmetsp:Transcript_27616/g.91728  ORF Transcript_27616/g.91728 Transcript_27616/m.91728 type:complete len:1393 (+) Transcript_27616:100-4278(+)
MSVTTYDSSFSYRQNQVARLGEGASNRGPMSAEDKKKFEASPFMQKMKEIDERSWQKFSERDKKRKDRDPNFKPIDADFETQKAHKYDKGINYYKVLGIDEYGTNEEVKKAYRKLSLTYHPDKTTGKTQEEKDEMAEIFMEVKNAYKTLSDEPTRRQYDFERDRDAVSADTHGKKVQEKVSFNAREAMKKILEKAKENQKAPSEVVRIPVQIRLEKLVYGGHKAIKRSRQVKDRFYGDFTESIRTFRMDIPAGAEQPWTAEFRRQGDQHEDKEPDTLRFMFSAKSHGFVDRSGPDLHVRQTVNLGEGFRRKPFIAADAPSIGGKHLLFWGRNPFLHSDGGDEGELRVKIAGEGASSKGALHVRFRLGLSGGSGPTSGTTSASSARSGAAPGSDGRAQAEFLKRFDLGPPSGFEEGGGSGGSSGGSAASSNPVMQRRLEQRNRCKPSFDLELAAVGVALGLFSKPTCSMQLFANLRQGTSPFFAICISSPPCGKQRAAGDWERLKTRLTPVLQKTGFYLFREPRGLLPRALTRAAAFPDRTFLASASAPPMPWKRLGDEAFARGDYWESARLYFERAGELGLNDEPEVAEARAPELLRGPDLVPEGAKVLSNLAACLAKLGDFASSLEQARRASALAPRWARPWARIGVAAWRVNARTEAIEAYKKAVEFDPSRTNVAALQSAVSQEQDHSAEAAHATKEEGKEAMKSGQLGLALAIYTVAIARLPPAADATAQMQKPDEHALLRAVLFANRAAAALRLRAFDAAADDGREAVSAQPALAAARCQLGAALLGAGMHQEGYVEFAKALQLEQDGHARARKGRNACLQEMLLWKSASANARFQSRFFIDLRRPRNTTRVFALSDIHFDHRENEDWVHTIDDSAFQEDVLIVAGNVADSKVAVGRCLTTLKQKFRRVFYTVGNHEMSVTHAEHARYPDSIAKLHAIIAECDELGVDIFPAPVCEGLTILPLFSWYSAEFDENDPFPDPNASYDKHCKWPMDADLQAWKYMAKLNEMFLSKPYYGTVISFSHFLPRRDLPFDRSKKNSAKSVGCEMIDEQARAAGSKIHVYGHSRTKHGQVHAGVRYANMPLGFETDWPKDHERRLMQLFDGKNLCTQEWGADGEPPLGYTKRVLHTTFFVMPGLREADRRKLQAALGKLSTLSGVQVTFGAIGSTKRTKQEFTNEIWPELEAVSCEATHSLVVVAEDVAALKAMLKSEAYKREFAVVAATFAPRSFSVDVPLGVDLKHERKPDPTLMLFCLRLGPMLTEDSEDHARLVKAAEAINKLPGIEGKIAVAFHPSGFGRFSQRELNLELGLEEAVSAGFTHVFAVAVDSPESWKMLSQSKTYGKWKAAIEAQLSKLRAAMPSLAAFALPLELTASAAAPRKEKKKEVLRR